MEKFTWQAKGSTIHQLCCTTLQITLQGSPNSQQNEWKGFDPVCCGCVSLERCLQLTVESLNNFIGDRVIRSRPEVLTSQELHQRCPQTRLKLSSSINCDGQRNSESCNPTSGKGEGNCFRCDVRHGQCLGPSSEAIDACEQVTVSTRWRERTDDVNMDLIEMGIWCCER